MMHLDLSVPTTRDFQVLCLGAHSDDIEIGCGGTILRLAETHPNCIFHWVVFSAVGAREAEARHGAAQFVPGDHLRGPHLMTFTDGFMPFSGAELKGKFEEFKKSINPDLIFTHYRNDSHQDHRLLAELTWNTFRDHLIMEYEIPKYDGDMGQPSLFVPLSLEQCDRKIRYLIDTFKSQRQKRWFEPETFRALMRLRGMECNSPSGYAEAFYGRKLTVGA